MSTSPAPNPASWRSRAFPARWNKRMAWLGLLLYVIYATSIIDVTWERFVRGIANGGTFLARMFPPETAPERMALVYSGLLESIQIAILSTFFGVLLSLPIALLAARNLMPPMVSWAARGVIAICRSFHYVIVSILFVKAVGFGALAGILALIVATIGFVAKLFAEAVEEMSMKPVEALRATGAPFFSIIFLAVLPQVAARFIGFTTYQLDSNLRNSTMVGIVGGGGIGATLFTAYRRFDYDLVLTILIATIILIMIAEALATRLRRIFQ